MLRRANALAVTLILAAVTPAGASDRPETLSKEVVDLRCTLDAAGACHVRVDGVVVQSRLRIGSVSGVGRNWQVEIKDLSGVTITALTPNSASGWSSKIRPFVVTDVVVSAAGSRNADALIRLERISVIPREPSVPQTSINLVPPNTVASQSIRIRRLGKSVARVTILSETELPRVCTAFLVAPDVVMTNYHCIDGVETAPRVVEFDYDEAHSDSKDYLAPELVAQALDDVAFQRLADVVLLRLESAPVGRVPLSLSTRAPRPGDNVITVSHPGGAPKQVSLTGCRVVSVLAPAAENIVDIAHSCSTEHGSSGAPVIDFDEDVVVAVHHAGFEAAGQSRTNRAVEMQGIVKWIRRAMPALQVVIS